MFNETRTHEITVDTVILTIKNDNLQVLLVKRENEPFKGKWAIPGGYVRMSEDLDAAAMRILKEKTNVDNIYLEQLYTFGDPLRHPVSRVITCAYFALIRAEDVDVIAADNVAWHKVSDLPALAFDHKEIIQYSLKRTRERLEDRKCLLREGYAKCPSCKKCGLLCGWGGAGAFSDGKLTLTPDVGGNLVDYMSRKDVEDLIDYADNLYLNLVNTIVYNIHNIFWFHFRF